MITVTAPGCINYIIDRHSIHSIFFSHIISNAAIFCKCNVKYVVIPFRPFLKL